VTSCRSACGIGRAIAEEYARLGEAVAMIDIAMLNATSQRTGFRLANMGEFDEAVADRTAYELGGLDFVVAKARAGAQSASERPTCSPSACAADSDGSQRAPPQPSGHA
jgi:NAD(P)-dependent dehydrogenase (short-subunit alcohol dehydrogenase family)